MRAALVLLILASSTAYAERVVVMTDDEQSSALELSLASRHVNIASAATPDGALRLDRAAAVQHAAMTSDASAGVWIDANEVCVVSADGAYFRHTPLPVDASPRVFAAIATSLLDELLAPPNVDVAVNVDVGPPKAVAITDHPMLAAQPTERWKHTLVEIGPTLSPGTYGLELELAFPILPNLRAGVLGGANQLYDGVRDFDPGTQMYDAAGEIRYVGGGETHFDLGLVGGIMRGTLDEFEGMASDTGGFAALRFSYVKEYASTAIMFSVAPMVLFDFDGQGRNKNAGIMSSIRLQLPI